MKIEERSNKIVEDVREFLKTHMHLISTDPAPSNRAIKVEESKEYKVAGDIITLLPSALEQCAEIETLSSEVWRLVRTIEDKRIILQTCLQILLGNANDETWLQSAVKEIEGITNERINLEVDKHSNQLLQILQSEAA